MFFHVADRQEDMLVAVRISGIIIVLSFIFALFSGNMTALSEAAVSGCSRAVTLTLSLLGMMCLWSGIMRCAQKAGFLDRLSAVMSPILKPLFPDAWKSGRGLSEISAAVAANILGVGNAATPLAIAAMKSLSDGKSDTATDDMVTFTVLGTAFPCIVPTTIVSLRAAAGSRTPLDILPTVWICSFCLSLFAAILSRTLAFSGTSDKRKKRKEGRL